MIIIYKVLRQIYETKIKTGQTDGWSEDYEKGYRYCLSLLLLAIESHPALNMHVEYMRLEKRYRDERQKLLKEIDRLRQHLSDKEESNRQLNVLMNLQSQSSLKRMIIDLQAQLHDHQLVVDQQKESSTKTESCSSLQISRP